MVLHLTIAFRTPVHRPVSSSPQTRPAWPRALLNQAHLLAHVPAPSQLTTIPIPKEMPGAAPVPCLWLCFQALTCGPRDLLLLQSPGLRDLSRVLNSLKVQMLINLSWFDRRDWWIPVTVFLYHQCRMCFLTGGVMLIKEKVCLQMTQLMSILIPVQMYLKVLFLKFLRVMWIMPRMWISYSDKGERIILEILVVQIYLHKYIVVVHKTLLRKVAIKLLFWVQ